MGVYDTYGELCGQLKVGDVCMNTFLVGDTVPIPDGVYVTLGSVIVVKDGIFIAEYEVLTDKWGGQRHPADVIMNPLKTVVNKVTSGGY